MKKFVYLLLIGIILSDSYKVQGQVNISAGSTITQDFSIGTSATATLPTGWKADKLTSVRSVGTYSSAVTATEYRAGNSMSPTASNGIYNYAAGDPASATDRAIGGISSSSGSKSVNIYVQLYNNGSSSIGSFTISYNVEKYRNGSNSEGFSIQMYYSTNGSTWTSAGADFLSSFTADANNNGFTSAPGSTASVSNKTLSQTLAPSSSLYLAWNYSVTSGTTTTNAQALGIDDVSITANFSEPTTQASNISFSSVTSNSFTISWTNGNGSNRAVFMKEGSGSITDPSDNTTYSASSNWSSKGSQLGTSGYYCIYNGNSNSVSVTNLSASTTYYVRVYEYNGSAGSENYYTASATNNPNNQTTSPSGSPTIIISGSLSAFSTTTGTASSAQTYSVSGDDLVADVVVTPPTDFEISTDGINYATSKTLSRSGGDLAGEPVTIYVRISSSASAGTPSGNITHTSSGATTQNQAVSGTVYATEPTVQAHSITFSSVTSSSFTVSWTRGNGSNVAIFMKEGSGPITNPSDGSSYSASADWSSKGSQLGSSGYYCIYSGSASSVAVSNLSSSTSYYVQAFEFNGSGSSSNFLTSTASGNPNNQSTSSPSLGWQISSTDVAYTIDFDGTVSGVNNGQFNGSGFQSSPSSGQLNSNAWAISGWSDGNLSFGDTKTTPSTDYTRGVSSGGVSTGGIYAFTVETGNRALGIQPGSGDWAPGSITLRFQNQTGDTISTIDISYDIYIFNDQGRSNSFNFSHSSDNSSFTNISSLDFSSTATADASPAWKRHFRSTSISGLSITNGDFYYLKWSGNDVSGSGSRDEFALDNISLIANPSSTSKLISGTLNGGVILSDITIYDNTTIDGEVSTSSGTSLTINSGKVLTINPGKSLSVNGSLINNAGTSGIVLKSDSSGSGNLIHNSSVSGTVERYLSVAANGAVHYISLPVSFALGSDLIDSTRGNFNVYEWTNSQSWNRIFRSDSLIPAKGYYVAYNNSNGTKILNFSGTLNYQDIDINISSTNSHWNLLGNPFCAPISCLSFTENNPNINGAIKFWADDGSGGSGFSASDYASWTSGGTTSANGLTPSDYIGIGQGFFVQSNGNGSTVHFDADWRYAYNPVFFTPDVHHTGRIWISVSDSLNTTNQILTGFNPLASDGFDRLFDSPKLKGNHFLAFYSLLPDNDSMQLDIQFLNSFDNNKKVWLGIDALRGGKYVFHVDSIDFFNDNVDIWFCDNLNAIKYDLRSTKTIEINLNPGVYEKRFYLNFGQRAESFDLHDKHLPQIFNSGKTLSFNYLDANEDNLVLIFNSFGQLLGKYVVNAEKFSINTDSLPKGVAFIMVNNSYSSRVFKTVLF